MIHFIKDERKELVVVMVEGGAGGDAEAEVPCLTGGQKFVCRSAALQRRSREGIRAVDQRGGLKYARS